MNQLSMPHANFHHENHSRSHSLNYWSVLGPSPPTGHWSQVTDSDYALSSKVIVVLEVVINYVDGIDFIFVCKEGRKVHLLNINFTLLLISA